MDTDILVWLACIFFCWIPMLAIETAIAAIRYARAKAIEVTYWRERAMRLECKHGDFWTLPPEDKP